MRTVRAELSKLASLPAFWFACVVGVLVPTGIVLLAGRAAPRVDDGYQELAVGVLGAIVLGVIAMSSEYTSEGAESAGGRQINTTLTAVPTRGRLFLAKALVVGSTSFVLAILATTAVFSVLRLSQGVGVLALTGDDLARMGGVIAYWVLMSLLGYGLTAFTRSGIIPLAVLLVNSSTVSVSYLLTKATPLANYLPDLAGMRMFSRDLATDVELSPLLGGAVMAVWVAGLLIVAKLVFARRDA
ncbi:hypothetical protein EV191_103378 [Tamaricihabitans halophyticus]|uniref:ABC-2 type transport system permease protein n=1 Tax=Tamaricihabitans halophyticus TaxID=1262583 RepID=A0A4R2QW73_9PSEU|nr:ABC transporter permease [Tamaricihabitans halophyticus]TCP54333.1 hypothetical protein EV191_103378 [Tamaricihabitans halophyticus]